MQTGIKQISFRATKEDLKIIEELTSKLGESQSQLIRRALAYLYHLETTKD